MQIFKPSALIATGLFLGCFHGDVAQAQSVGAPAVDGYNSTTECGTGPSPCFRQYGNPIPVAISPTASTTYSIAPSSVTASASGLVLCTASCNLYSVEFTSLTAAFTGYAMVFDATAVPSNGAVTPKHCWPVPGLGSIVRDFRSLPEQYATGVAVAFSNNTAGCFTLTASATAFISGDVK